MHKILVHAQDSCACTTLFCMHNTLVHALVGTQKKRWGVRPGPAFLFGSRPWSLAPPVHAQKDWTYLCNLSIIRSVLVCFQEFWTLK